MIKVMIGNNVKRESALLDEEHHPPFRSGAVRQSDYTRGLMHLDGAPLGPGDLDKTFADFGITERCFLLNVVEGRQRFPGDARPPGPRVFPRPGSVFLSLRSLPSQRKPSGKCRRAFSCQEERSAVIHVCQ